MESIKLDLLNDLKYDFKNLNDEFIEMCKYGLPMEFTSSKKNKKVFSKKKKIYSFKERKYILFKKFDEGIKIDNESYAFVTPEEVAKNISEYCLKRINYSILIDGFCGCGGNIIQFAKQNPNSIIIAIDNNIKRILNAKHNAKIYNVDKQIEFIVGDYMTLAKTSNFKSDLVFLSPPWGGTEYLKYKKFKFNLMPINGKDIYYASKNISNNIAYYLPRNFDINEYQEFNEKITIVENLLEKKVSTYVIYSGNLTSDNENKNFKSSDENLINKIIENNLEKDEKKL